MYLNYPTVEEVLECYKEIEKNIPTNKISSIRLIDSIIIMQEVDGSYYSGDTATWSTSKVDYEMLPIVKKLEEVYDNANDIKYVGKRFLYLLKKIFKSRVK